MPARRKHLALATAFAVVVLCGVVVAPASAHPLGGMTPPMAGLFDFLSPIKNIAELITKVVAKLFGALAKVLMPDFLKHASVETLKGLVAVPNLSNPRRWHNVGELRSGTTAIAWALLPLPFTIATIRYLIGTFTDGPHPIMAVTRLVGAAFGLVMYPWAAGQVFALINVLTNSLLSMPAVGNGLQRAVGVLFGAAIIAGIASPFLACLALVAIVMGTLLFGLKIAILMIFALLYVTGPLMIALATLQETAHLYRAWLFASVALAFIPIGWCLIFAVAGALTLDASSGGISAGLIAKDMTSALAALLAFGLAVMWPKLLISQALRVAGGMGISLRGTGAGSPTRSPASPARAQSAMRQLRDGALTVGKGVGRAMGQLGAPAGGVAGWAGRLMTRTAPGAALAGMASGAGAALAGRAAQIRVNAASGQSGRAGRAAAEVIDTVDQLRTKREPDPTGRPSSDSASAGHAPSSPPQPAASPDSVPVDNAPRQSGRRSRSLSAEQRAVLSRLPDGTPSRVRHAVIHAKPGRAAQAATRAAQRCEAPLSPQTRRAVFAAAASATSRDATSAYEGAQQRRTRQQAGDVPLATPVPALSSSPESPRPAAAPRPSSPAAAPQPPSPAAAPRPSADAPQPPSASAAPSPPAQTAPTSQRSQRSERPEPSAGQPPRMPQRPDDDGGSR